MDRLTGLWGADLRWELDQGAHPHEALLLSLDCAKARKALGWRPRMTLDTALEWTVRWYKAFLEREDMRRLSEDQIAQYQRLEAA
jgi:CDP-glucose 4,6-dehydratase